MVTISRRVLLWGPRILGILVSLFIGSFALDAFSQGKPLFEAIPDFVVHLIPALILLVLVGASWRWEWIGGVAFVGLALVYATTMAGGRLDWTLVISGPLMLVGVLFLWSWRHHGDWRAT